MMLHHNGDCNVSISGSRNVNIAKLSSFATKHKFICQRLSGASSVSWPLRLQSMSIMTHWLLRKTFFCPPLPPPHQQRKRNLKTFVILIDALINTMLIKSTKFKLSNTIEQSITLPLLITLLLSPLSQKQGI